jgi:hypothetical protein
VSTGSTSNFSQSELDKFGELAHRWWGEAELSRDALKRISRRRAPGQGCPGRRHAPWMAAERL